MEWSSEVDGWQVTFSVPEQSADPDDRGETTQILKRHGEKCLADLQELIHGSIRIETCWVGGVFVVGSKRDCLNLKQQVEERGWVMSKVVPGAIFGGASTGGRKISVRIILMDRAESVMDGLRGNYSTFVHILVPEANNLLLWTWEKNVFFQENFFLDEECTDIGGGELPYDFLELALQFAELRKSLHQRICDALPRDVNDEEE